LAARYTRNRRTPYQPSAADLAQVEMMADARAAFVEEVKMLLAEDRNRFLRTLTAGDVDNLITVSLLGYLKKRHMLWIKEREDNEKHIDDWLFLG